MWTKRRAVAVVAAAFALAGGREASGYVQYRTSANLPISWRPECFPLPVMVYPGTFSQMTKQEIAAAVTGATDAWNSDANACTYLRFQVQLATAPAPRAARDGTNAIIFRENDWCALDVDGLCDPSAAGAYDPAARAVTTVYASGSTGEVREVDIEINARSFLWADRVTHPELTDRYDLQNALTQQIGHLLGFDWACFTGQGVRRNDHTGQPTVDCSSAPDAIRSATMFPIDSADGVERRTLAADDQAGLCALYPAAAKTCQSDAGAACTCPTAADAGQDAAGTDAGVADAGATVDATAADRATADGGGQSAGDGCSCATAPLSAGRSGAGLALLWTALLAVTRRRRRG